MEMVAPLLNGDEAGADLKLFVLDLLWQVWEACKCPRVP
jgi:hypothetical protein